MTAGLPSQGQFASGVPVTQARAALVMLHGRGASAQDILALSGDLDVPGFAYLAPQAEGAAWYPNPFTAPLASNEPWLTRALAIVDEAVEGAVNAGVARENILLLGFSQGASLALEYAARYGSGPGVSIGDRIGGIVAFSGGLIGADEELASSGERYPAGGLQGVPVFIGCSDVDMYIPKARVEWSARRLEALGAQVTVRLYPGMGHTVNLDELEMARAMMRAAIGEG